MDCACHGRCWYRGADHQTENVEVKMVDLKKIINEAIDPALNIIGIKPSKEAGDAAGHRSQEPVH